MYKKICTVLSLCLVSVLLLQPVAAAAELEELLALNQIPFFKPNDVVCSPQTGQGMSGNTNQEKIWTYLLSAGLSSEQAAGIMGNMKQESGFSPTRQEDSQAFPRGGWGLVQWTFGRRTNIVKALEQKHPDLMQFYSPQYGKAAGPDGVPSGLPIEANDKLLEFELQYMIEESKSRPVLPASAKRFGKAANEWELLKTLTTVEDATVFWHNNFEVSADSAAKVLSGRGKPAKEIHSQLNLTGGGSSRNNSSNTSATSSKITFIGDSITAGMKSELSSTFTGSTVEAEVGKGIDWVISRLDSITINDTVVINIGTNDNFPVDKGKAMLEKLKDKKVYLVNNFGKGGNADFEIINRNILSATTGLSYVKVLDWKKEAEANGGREKLYDADGYHINAGEGRSRYIAFLKSSITDIPSTDNCKKQSEGDGSFSSYVMKYAWPDTQRKRLERKEEYTEAVTKAVSEGRYVGIENCGRRPSSWSPSRRAQAQASRGGSVSPTAGIDCGGFVTILLYDSGFSKEYNHGANKAKGAGPTGTQRAWAEQNWQKLGTGNSINTADLKPGDVAHSPGHTFIYVGDIPGFGSKIASASLCTYAPQAGAESITSAKVTWFRKK